MKHSYETGVNKKMVFFRMLHSDFSRMIKSWKFYLTIAFIAVLTFLSIYPEAAGSGGNCSVYYLVNARGGVSAFLVTNTILVVLPFALSYWEDVQKNYINCILPRVHSSVYSFSHVLMTAFDGFLAVFLGYSLCFGLMALRLPLITSDPATTATGGAAEAMRRAGTAAIRTGDAPERATPRPAEEAITAAGATMAAAHRAATVRYPEATATTAARRRRTHNTRRP